MREVVSEAQLPRTLIQHFHGYGDERGAGKRRLGRSEDAVDRGSTSPQVVIIHARQIIMNETVSMHPFEGRSDREAILVIPAQSV